MGTGDAGRGDRLDREPGDDDDVDEYTTIGALLPVLMDQHALRRRLRVAKVGEVEVAYEELRGTVRYTDSYMEAYFERRARERRESMDGALERLWWQVQWSLAKARAEWKALGPLACDGDKEWGCALRTLSDEIEAARKRLNE